jgi:SAM-dependent methyltransferase
MNPRTRLSDADYGHMIDALNRVHYAGETAFYGTEGLRPPEEALYERLQPGARILDVGCGAGRVTSAAAHYGVSTIGIDINRASLQAARVKDPDTTVAQARMGSIPFATSSFDHVWCLRFSFNALPTASERTRTIRELWRVCAPGGTVVIEAFNWHFGGRYNLIRVANLLDLTSRRLRWRGQGRAGSPPLPDRDVIYLANKAPTAAPGYAHLTTIHELHGLASRADVSSGFAVTDDAGLTGGDLSPIRSRHRGYATWLVISKPEGKTAR